jgi:hypothetical protein
MVFCCHIEKYCDELNVTCEGLKGMFRIILKIKVLCLKVAKFAFLLYNLQNFLMNIEMYEKTNHLTQPLE